MLVTLDTLTSDGGPGDSENVYTKVYFEKHRAQFQATLSYSILSLLKVQTCNKNMCIIDHIPLPNFTKAVKGTVNNFTFTHLYKQ